MQNSRAPQRIAYQGKAIALRYTLMLLTTDESADDRCNDMIIATITFTCAETVTFMVTTTARALVKGIPQFNVKFNISLY